MADVSAYAGTVGLRSGGCLCDAMGMFDEEERFARGRCMLGAL